MSAHLSPEERKDAILVLRQLCPNAHASVYVFDTPGGQVVINMADIMVVIRKAVRARRSKI